MNYKLKGLLVLCMSLVLAGPVFSQVETVVDSVANEKVEGGDSQPADRLSDVPLDVVQSLDDGGVVPASALKFIKTVALDIDCDGREDGPYMTNNIVPARGQCIKWKLQIYNNSHFAVCNVLIEDGSPLQIGTIKHKPFFARHPVPGEGSCESDGHSLTCVLGNRLDPTGNGVSQDSCLRSQEMAEVHYGVVVR